MTLTPGSAARQAPTDVARLVGRAQRGDALAFAALHADFARSVHAVLLARLPVADVEDALQETFVLAWKRLPSLRDLGAVGPWLHAIARNVARDGERRRPHERSDGGASLAPLPAREEERPSERDELRGRVMEHLRSLPDAYRETLAMRLVEGMTGPEIAQATGLTEGSVRVNLCRGMGLLRELLAKEGWP